MESSLVWGAAAKSDILIRFTDVPDRGRNAGWLCRPANYQEGDPLGSGRTIREAFLNMLERIEEEASESALRKFAVPAKEKP